MSSGKHMSSERHIVIKVMYMSWWKHMSYGKHSLPRRPRRLKHIMCLGENTSYATPGASAWGVDTTPDKNAGGTRRTRRGLPDTDAGGT